MWITTFQALQTAHAVREESAQRALISRRQRRDDDREGRPTLAPPRSSRPVVPARPADVR